MNIYAYVKKVILGIGFLYANLLLIIVTSLSAPFVLPALDIIQHLIYSHIHLNCGAYYIVSLISLFSLSVMFG